jgi:hypothetical protein
MTLLMAGIRGIDNEGPFTRPPESNDGSTVPHLFLVRNMFFFLWESCPMPMLFLQN